MEATPLALSAAVLAAEAEGPPPFLVSTAVLVVAAAVIGYVSVRAKVVPIVGFLLAGVVIGPAQLGIVGEVETVEAAAEVGVIFLLFIIGIEFSLERLTAMRTWIVLGGLLQVGLAVGAVAGICLALGVGWRDAVFTGFLVSLSSTAIVLKLLGDARETTTVRGRLAVALLVFQDLAVVAMVLFVPLLGAGAGEGEGSSTGELVLALLTAVGIIAVVLVGARRVLPPLLERVARTCSPEVFLLTVLAVCFGTATLTALAGVSVSLGAFLAGLLVSESRLSSQALGEILPLQILFSAVFFVSVGMLLDVRFVLANLPVVVAGVLGLFVVKLLTTWLAVGVLRRASSGIGAGPALGSALLLAQIGEFSFVLETVGRTSGLSPAGLGEDGSQAFIAASVILLIATPAMAALGRRVEARLEGRDDARRQAAAAAARAESPAGQAADDGTGSPGGPGDRDDGQVLLSGWGPATRAVARELRARGVDLTVTTLNPDGAAEAEADGHRVVMGDSSKQAVLEMAGLERTRLLVVAEDDSEQTLQIAGVVAGLARYDVPVVARPLGGTDVRRLVGAGVHRVVDPEGASRHALTKAVLSALGDAGGPLPRVLLPVAGEAGEGATSTVDMSRVVVVHPDPQQPACRHLDPVPPVLPTAVGCEECLRLGTSWVHLRVCTACGTVGCCDSSPGQHARGHAGEWGHPVVASLEPGETWAYCFEDRMTVDGQDGGAGSA
ncbi:cation:proton antiporter domain-containing protein [Aquipuribacter sp. SD81]|uniref:cation:proton antiporter domain-containing protein n=1 Tax=Aquipuribacter sp. SD81 TaxID=3127703 RepID=UPI00301B1148